MMNKQLQDEIKYLTPEEVEAMGIKLKPAKPRRYKLEDEIEYDSIEELVSMAVQYGIIPKEQREDIVIYLKAIYKNGVFSDPTDVTMTNDGEIRIPYTLNALKGLLRQREKMIAKEKSLIPTEIPKQLATEEAKYLLEKAINSEIVTISNGNYNWNRNVQLCSYFADRASHYLNLSKTMDKNGNLTTSWQPFEVLFHLKEGSLKNAKQNWMRLYNAFEPSGFEEIDLLFP